MNLSKSLGRTARFTKPLNSLSQVCVERPETSVQRLKLPRHSTPLSSSSPRLSTLVSFFFQSPRPSTLDPRLYFPCPTPLFALKIFDSRLALGFDSQVFPTCFSFGAALRQSFSTFPRSRFTLRATFGSLIHKVPTFLLLRSRLSAVFLGAPQCLDSRAGSQPCLGPSSTVSGRSARVRSRMM